MQRKPERVPSPCIRNCCLGTDDVCLGCFRTLEEITGWQQSDDAARRAILENAERRRRARIAIRLGIEGNTPKV